MKKNTKKKVLTLTLVILLLSIVIVGGSLAWFTAEDQVDNVFTVGSISVKNNEYQLDENGAETEYVNEDKVFMPIVNTETPSEDPNYQDKIVKVENTGKNPAYIRTHIAIPVELVDYLILDDAKSDWDLINKGNLGTTYVGDQEYAVYTYNYLHELMPGKETVTAVLNGVYLDAKTDVQENANGDLEFCRMNDQGEFDFSGFVVKNANSDNYNAVHVLVATQAVQAEGFDVAKQALETAFEGKLPEFTITESGF